MWLIHQPRDKAAKFKDCKIDFQKLKRKNFVFAYTDFWRHLNFFMKKKLKLDDL